MTFQFREIEQMLNSKYNNKNLKKFYNLLDYVKPKIDLYLNKYEDKYLLSYQIANILYNLHEGLNITNSGSISNEFLKQLDMNNNQDIFGIINLYFPYIDDKNNMKNQKNMKNVVQVIESKNKSIGERVSLVLRDITTLISKDTIVSHFQEHVQKIEDRIFEKQQLKIKYEEYFGR